MSSKPELNSFSFTCFFTPAFIASFVMTFLSFHVLSPTIGSTISVRYRKLPKDSRMALNSLLASTLHALTVVPLIIFVLSTGHLGPDRMFSQSTLGMTIMHISFGYLVADTILSLCNHSLRQSSSYLLHHVTALIGIGTSIFYHGTLMFFIVYRLISEFSTPFLNFTVMLHGLGVSKLSLLFKAAAGLTLLSFFLCRVAVIPWHWYEVLICLAAPSTVVTTAIKCAFFVIYLVFDLLNVYWFSLLVTKASSCLN